MSDLLARLSAPFPPATVSWRVGATTQDKTKGMALAYIDARDVQDRLNEVCGHEWQVRHPWSTADGKLACEIGIKIDGEWLWRGDGAGNSDVEAEKGAFSDSFKRAAVRWGIGRYLYDIDSPWVALEQRGKSYAIAERELSKLQYMLRSRLSGAERSEAPARPAASHETYGGPGAGRTVVANGRRPPSTLQKLSELRDAIHTAIVKADSADRIDGIIRVHEEDLKLIHAASIPTHDRLIAFADARKKLLAATTTAHDARMPEEDQFTEHRT